jgi:hypothetical protein
MPGPSNRSVVIISGLLTLLVLGGATLGVAFRNGWVQVASATPPADGATALAPPTGAVPSAAPAAAADSGEVAVYRQKLEEAYRALDEAYAQVRSLQTAQSQVASRGGGERESGDDDDDRRERRPRRRESDDN